MTAHERTACEGEVCSCGRPAVRAFVVDGVVTPFCGITDDGLMLRVWDRRVTDKPIAALVSATVALRAFEEGTVRARRSAYDEAPPEDIVDLDPDARPSKSAYEMV